MGERYGASITASPTMKVLYFRAVTRNLAPSPPSPTRGLRGIPCSRIGFTMKPRWISYFTCNGVPPHFLFHPWPGRRSDPRREDSSSSFGRGKFYSPRMRLSNDESAMGFGICEEWGIFLFKSLVGQWAKLGWGLNTFDLRFWRI